MVEVLNTTDNHYFSSMMGLIVPGVTTTPALTERLSHALAGCDASSRHVPAVFAATAPLR